MIDDGKNDGLCILLGVLAGVEKAAVSVSNEGIEDDEEELGVVGTAVAAADAIAAGVGATALGTAAAGWPS